MSGKEISLDKLSGRMVGGRYRLGRLLGNGNFGYVYEAQQYVLDTPVRRVALKIVDVVIRSVARQREQLADALTVIRLMESAGSSATARHVVNVLDLGVDSDLGARPYVAMEYLPRELGQLLGNHDAGVGLQRTLKWIEETLLGLTLLHGADKPVIHRDLKPNNLLLDTHDAIKIADFGLAVAAPMVQADGTIAYMAPESLRSNICVMESDIYAVGLIAWQLLTGRHPYADKAKPTDSKEAMLAAQSGQWRPLRDQVSELRNGAQPQLERWVHRCLAPNVQQRFPSAMEALRQFRRMIENRPVHAAAPRSRSQVLADIHVYIQHKNWKRALDECEKYSARAPYDEELLILEARVLCALERAPEAVEKLRRGLQKQPTRTLRFALADSLERAGNVNAARGMRRLAQGR